ncbi:hypothetical protein KIN20_010938 [Parelaphostrongylus tenuis]|uniref:Serine-threonine/tyrosine-protein kinase catalytic domain-containing protein n=1 Tax=Parelaphostrongylus tenuis TaxID=148309 RepID=A0AAD5MZP6_PARTN|nr:hypothetical protein KIN20_010938 [Parelaphostrongylus tenuis]
MERPDNCPENFYEVMCECWTRDPEKRPDFLSIRQKLAAQLEEITEEYSYLTLDAGKDYYNVQYDESKPDIIVIPETELITSPTKEPLSETSTLSMDSLAVDDDASKWSNDIVGETEDDKKYPIDSTKLTLCALFVQTGVLTESISEILQNNHGIRKSLSCFGNVYYDPTLQSDC